MKILQGTSESLHLSEPMYHTEEGRQALKAGWGYSSVAEQRLTTCDFLGFIPNTRKERDLRERSSTFYDACHEGT